MKAQIGEKKDSMYYKIENFSNKRKFSKFLYKFIFRKNADTAYVSNKDKNKTKQTYKQHHIRNIYIHTTDPFGYDEKYRVENPKWYEKLANHLHSKSREFTIRSYLLFKKGELYNAQKLYESERLLRSMNFINRASISVIDSTATKDSIDIRVNVLDSWSLHPKLSFSTPKLGLGLTEENFMGLGHEAEIYYREDFNNHTNNLSSHYKVNNICQTFINAQILGERDFDRNERINFRVYRDFFSPLTRWAGGVTIEYFKRNVTIPLSMDVQNFPSDLVKVQQQDYWAGMQFSLDRNEDRKITNNISAAIRFQNYRYVNSPSAMLDPAGYFSPYQLFLGSIGYNQRKFSVEQNIFDYNLPEDIPYGKAITLTGGFTKQYDTQYPYVGLTTAYGHFFKIGYFNFKVQYGSFFKEEKGFRSTFRIDGTYFSPIQDWKFASVRHFISPTLVLGNDRLASYKDRINFNGTNEFPVYNENFVGKDKLIIRYQLQTFIKKTYKNFHFNPYFITALGWLSQDHKNLFQSKIHTKFGIGLAIYNPFLVFNRFQISFVYYPSVPFDDKGVFEFNRYRNDYIPINSFAIDIPNIVNYNR